MSRKAPKAVAEINRCCLLRILSQDMTRSIEEQLELERQTESTN